MAWINFGNGLTQIDLVNNKFRIVGSKSEEYFNVVSSEELEGYVQLNPSSPQSGFIYLDSENPSVPSRLRIGDNGASKNPILEISRQTNDAGTVPFFGLYGGYGFASGVPYAEIIGGDNRGSNYSLLDIGNATGTMFKFNNDGSFAIETTPTTDAAPANILTWDATTKEVKKVAPSDLEVGNALTWNNESYDPTLTAFTPTKVMVYDGADLGWKSVNFTQFKTTLDYDLEEITANGNLANGDIMIKAGNKFAYSANAYYTPEDNVQGSTFKTPGGLVLDVAANTMVGYTSDNGRGGKLQVNGKAEATQYQLSALNTAPSSSTDTGTTGEIRVTAGFIYVCVATNTWVRSALSTW